MADAVATKPKVTPETLADLGFQVVTVETEVGGDKFPISYHTSKGNADAWEALCEFRGDNFREFAAKALDEIQTQRATQGNKGLVRDAKAITDSADPTENRTLEEVVAAGIKKIQEKAFAFILGKPREKSAGGLTVKQNAALGAAMMGVAVAKGGITNVTNDDILAIALELGIDPKLLGGPVVADEPEGEEPEA